MTGSAGLPALPILVAVSHGTADPAGQGRIAALAEAVASRTAAEVRLAHVDVQSPRVGEVLASLPENRPAVVVPVLLSAGYHVRVDLAEAAAGRSPVASALGPDERLVDLLVRRTLEAGFVRGHHRVVLAAAGSTDAGAVADCRTVASRLAHRLGTPVSDAYLSAAHPTVTAAVGSVGGESPGRPVIVVSYLLAPGYFQARLVAEADLAGAETTSAPLLGAQGPVPAELAELVVARFAATVEGCSIPGTTARGRTASPC
ncbi:CbiX/SirB N-terminal domain-containing protein [Citricoccus nitrophenolicus]|uniref:CbiX/SirB N-terminal domain-containing protein n=1 Tax=Citricoccus nitrophenolicus TaxID=863575 RepID=A0ABV0IJA0_9MICC|nr:CbiX/SirB N-terminal domain-containing protein [Citricoccus sp. I39-566]WMY78215.1 CbiX/SirB N-terminal domain-containing protein [Citricoccus sp. I39-566]